MFSLNKLAKLFLISAFIVSEGIIFVYVNYLMVVRPEHKIVKYGFIYPFFGKHNEIYISRADYLIVLASVAVLLFSMILANRLYKAKK